MLNKMLANLTTEINQREHICVPFLFIHEKSLGFLKIQAF